jgi:hypothetical protein
MQFYCKPNQFLIQIEKGKIISKKLEKSRGQANQPRPESRPSKPPTPKMVRCTARSR